MTRAVVSRLMLLHGCSSSRSLSCKFSAGTWGPLVFSLSKIDLAAILAFLRGKAILRFLLYWHFCEETRKSRARTYSRSGRRSIGSSHVIMPPLLSLNVLAFSQ